MVARGKKSVLSTGLNLESLEGRRFLSVGDLIELPMLAIDIPGTASATNTLTPGVKRLDIKATSPVAINTAGASSNLTPPAIVEIAILVNSDGTLNAGVATQDLLVYQDLNTSGNYNAGDTLLLSGEVKTTGTGFKVAGVTTEFIFATTGGTWTTDTLFFMKDGGGSKDAGVQLDLTGPGGIPISFASEFSGYQPKGVLGSIPPIIPPGTASISGLVYNDCDDDGKFEPADPDEYPIPGVTVTLLDSNGNVVGTDVTDANGIYSFGDLQPGTYTLVESQPAGYLDGKESIGTVNGTPRGTIPPNSNDRITQITLAGTDQGINYNFAEVEPSSLSGTVYVDANCNRELDIFDGALPGVDIKLYDGHGKLVATTKTDDDGFYIFTNLRPGTYTIVEESTTGLWDGKEQVGSLGGFAFDSCGYSAIKCIEVECGEDGICYNFGEKSDKIKCGQTANICFWANKNGQKLLTQLKPGLGNWLASTFPNMFGSFAGKTNAQVGQAFITRFQVSGIKLDAQVLAVTFAVYATDYDLGGTAASAYGFRVNEAGLGAALFNVGSKGEAFNIPKYTTTTVYELLQRADAMSSNGILYDVNGSGSLSSSENNLRSLANAVFTAINEAGDVA
jgi:hypothetical protein